MRALYSTAAAGLVLALLAATAAATRMAPARELLQVGGTCSSQIPACETGRCVTQLVDGVSSAVCQRCKPGFVLADKGLQCVCARGRYETATAAGATPSCADCGQGFYCPGGNTNARNGDVPTARGRRLSCASATPSPAGSPAPTGLTTKSTRAFRHTDCVALPGFRLSNLNAATQAAEACTPNTYNRGFNRLRTCIRCQSGTMENPSFASSANPLRSDKLDVCQVPPGRFLSQNVVRPCAIGTFRSTWEASNNANARFCFSCPKGITTAAAGADAFGDCNVVLPGFKVDQAWVTSQGSAGLPDQEPAKCDKGTYFSGGPIPPSGTTCLPCPYGTTTNGSGATSRDDCAVPPGYFLSVDSLDNPSDTASTLTKCPTSVTIGTTLPQGTFRSGWASWQDKSVRALSSGTASDGRDACTKCGNGILSDRNDFDEHTETDSSVATSSSSCFIEAGWGMIFNPTTSATSTNSNWTALPCPASAYGVPVKTYGLQQAPCKPCPRNTVTSGGSPATSFEQCLNAGGFGYTADGVNRCQEGFWAAAGSMLACTPCPSGRTTLPQDFAAWDGTKQDAANDCVVKEGRGIYSTSAQWAPNESGDAALPLSALECPVGTYSDGLEVDSKCASCPTGFTTADQGTVGSTPAVCTKCSAGYGNGPTTCTACGYGTFQPGFTGAAVGSMGDGETCITCSRTNYTYISSTGSQARLESDGMTLYEKSRGPEACVPRFQQLIPDAGQIFKLPSLTAVTSINSAAACVAECTGTNIAANEACFAQFQYTAATRSDEAGSCQVARLTAAQDTAVANVLLVKLIPSDPIAAASVKAKAMSSGIYARLQGVSGASYGNLIGAALTSTTEADCRARCDADSTCWAVHMTSASECSLRTGEDLLNARSIYVNPAPSAPLEALKW